MFLLSFLIKINLFTKLLKILHEVDNRSRLVFRELTSKEVRIRRPAVIVTALTALLSANQYLTATKLSQAFPPELASFVRIGGYIEVIASFIAVFAVWLILAVIMHGLSAFFGGKGSFRRTFEFVGYGFLPSLIGAAVTAPLSAYYILNAEVPEVSIAQLQENPHIAKSLILSIVPKNLIYSNLLISIAITAWSLLIWSFAVKHSRRIELKKALVCAVIPTALFCVYQIRLVLGIT